MKIFERNFARNCVKNGLFSLQNISVENSLICPRAKSSNHCLTELLSIYQNKHGTIKRRDDHIVVQLSHPNIFKIDWFFYPFYGRQMVDIYEIFAGEIVWKNQNKVCHDFAHVLALFYPVYLWKVIFGLPFVPHF